MRNENTRNLVEKFDQEWPEGGFLYRLREGEFDAHGCLRLESLFHTLKQLDDATSDVIDRELVRTLWFIPQFVEWQTERAIDSGADAEAVHTAASNLRELVGEILGEP